MFLTNNTFSEIVKSFKVEGNERVSKKTIINFADVEINTDLNTSDFNRIIKNLYSTNFFENIFFNISKVNNSFF